MIAGSMSSVKRDVAVMADLDGESGVVPTAMSSTWSGRSSRNLSMEQSCIEQVVLVLLHVSLRRCWPSLADEWWNKTGRLLMQARRF